VRPFEALSDAGKLRRVRTLAEAALRHYDLARPTLAFHGFATNVLYRVTTQSGERFVLRLAVPGWRTLEDHSAEAAWLDALARDTTVGAPRIVPTRSGAAVLPPRRAGRAGDLERAAHDLAARPAARAPPERAEPRAARRAVRGAPRPRRQLDAAGGLHPAAVRALAVAWRGEPAHRPRGCRNGGHGRAAHRVIAHRSTTSTGWWRRRTPRSTGATCASSTATCGTTTSSSTAALHPFDFEDTVWGFRAHDIAMAMLDLLEVTDEARYATLLSAFRQGYEAHAAWPDDAIEPFQLGRLLWMLNWIARNEPRWFADAVERHVAVFEHYRRTGHVVRAARPRPAGGGASP
jgi:hypothetical protein